MIIVEIDSIMYIDFPLDPDYVMGIEIVDQYLIPDTNGQYIVSEEENE